MAQIDLLHMIGEQITDLAQTRRGVMEGRVEPQTAITVATVSNSFSRTVREHRETDRYLTAKAMIAK